MALPAHRAGERLPLTSGPLTLRPATPRSATLCSAPPVSAVRPLRQAAPSAAPPASLRAHVPTGRGPRARGSRPMSPGERRRGRRRAVGRRRPVTQTHGAQPPPEPCAAGPHEPHAHVTAPSPHRPVDLSTHRLIDSSTIGSSAEQPAPWPVARPVARSTSQTARPVGRSTSRTVGPRLRAAAPYRALQPPTPAAVSFDCRLSAAAAAPTRPASVPITAGATVSRRTKDSVA